MRGSTATLSLTSLASRFESSLCTRSRSCASSSMAVVTVARTRPAASSARRWNSSSMPAASSMRPDSIRSRARLVPSSSSGLGDVATSASRCSVAMVGLLSTAATSGSARSSRTSASRPDHCWTEPSCCARSNAALAYLLAAAVATRDLLYGAFDEVAVLALVEGLADDLLRGHDDHARHLVARRLQRPLTLRLDLLAGVLTDAPRLLFRLLLQVLPHLLARLVGGLLQLLRDGAPARLGHLDDLWVHVPGEDREHHQERQHLDDHSPVEVDDAGGALGGQQDHCDYFDGTLERNTNQTDRLMKYIASTRPTIVNSQGIIR